MQRRPELPYWLAGFYEHTGSGKSLAGGSGLGGDDRPIGDDGINDVIEFTAEGGAFFRVYVDGNEVSKHTTQYKAQETAQHKKFQYPESEVWYEYPGARIVAKTSIIIFPQPLGTARLTGNQATGGINSPVISTGVAETLNNSQLQLITTDVGVKTDIDVTAPVSLAAISASLGTGADGGVDVVVETDQPPTIISTPSISFTLGPPDQTYELSQHVSDDGVSPLTYAVQGSLGAYVSLNTSTGRLTYSDPASNGSNLSGLTFTVTDAVDTAGPSSPFDISLTSAPTDDWAIRIADPGVLKYDRFDAAPPLAFDSGPREDIGDGAWGPGNAHTQIVWDQTEQASGNGCMKIHLREGQEGSSINYKMWLKPPIGGTLDPQTGRWSGGTQDVAGFDVGDTYYLSFRIFHDTNAWAFNTANGLHGWKFAIISWHEGSSTAWEVTIISSDRAPCFPTTYGAEGQIGHEGSVSTPCNPNNITYQNKIDSGFGPINNCYDAAERYGPIRWLSTGTFGDDNDQVGPAYINASPPQAVVHPFSRAAINGIAVPDRAWLSVMLKVTIRSWIEDDSQNDVLLYLAPEGEDWTLVNEVSIANGNPVALQPNSSSPQTHNTCWFTPFHNGGVTGSRAQGGGDTYVLYDEIICSTEFIQAPGFAVPTWFPDDGESVQIDTVNAIGDITGTSAIVSPENPFGPDPTSLNLSGDNSVKSKFSSFSGGAYAPNQGVLGSLLCFGGGHGQFAGNDVVELDIYTRKWSRQQAPTAPPTYDSTYSEYAPGQPTTFHTYGQTQVWPGGGANGRDEYIVLWGNSPHTSGGGSTGWTHTYALDPNHVGNRWRRGGQKSTPAVSEGGTGLDEGRGVFWGIGTDPNVPLGSYNPVTETWTEHNTISGRSGKNEWCADFWPEGDFLVYVNVGQGGVYQMGAIDVAPTDTGGSATLSLPVETGSLPPTSHKGIGVTWCPPLGKFVCWTGGVGNTFYLLEPGANWVKGGARTDSWNWTTYTFTPTISSDSGAAVGPYNGLRWLSRIPNKAYILVRAWNQGQPNIGHYYMVKIPDGT